MSLRIFPGLRCLKQRHMYHNAVDENGIPMHNESKRIPFTLQERIKGELKSKEEMIVFENLSDLVDWTNPTVVVKKKNPDKNERI